MPCSFQSVNTKLAEHAVGHGASDGPVRSGRPAGRGCAGGILDRRRSIAIRDPWLDSLSLVKGTELMADELRVQVWRQVTRKKP